MVHTSNVKKLIAHKMSIDAVPPGGGVISAIEFLSSTEKVIAGVKAATKWVEEAIAVVKSAPDNPYQSDDEIAAAILKGIEDRKKEKPKLEDLGGMPIAP